MSYTVETAATNGNRKIHTDNIISSHNLRYDLFSLLVDSRLMSTEGEKRLRKRDLQSYVLNDAAWKFEVDAFSSCHSHLLVS